MADVVESFEKLLSYGAPANDSCHDGTLFRFEGERWFFLSNADKDALRARLSQAGAGECCDGYEAQIAVLQQVIKDRDATIAALAPSPSAGEDSLHHVTGERITRKDLNNAYRKGMEDGRLATHLIDGMWPEAAAEPATPPATPVQPTASVEAVLAAYEAQTEKLPLGAAGPERGNSTYDWRKLIIKELRELAASLTPAPTQGDGEPVAWRWRLKDRSDWIVTTNRDDIPKQFGVTGRDKVRNVVEPEIQPLYATPSAPVSAPSPAGGVREALAILQQAHAAHIKTTCMQTITGETDAERRASAGEARDYAAEVMFGELGALTFEHLDALVAALSSPTASEPHEVITALLAEEPFVFDPATNFAHADDGGAPPHGVKWAPVEPEPVSAPANGEVVEAAARIIDPMAFSLRDDHYVGTKAMPGIPTALQQIALKKARNVLALNPAPGHGEGG